MNRFEVLRGINAFLMIPTALIAVLSGIISIVTFNYIFIIVTILFTILTFGLRWTLGELMMRAHQEYFPKNAVIVPKDKWNDVHIVSIGDPSIGKSHITHIPRAKIVTED